MKPAAGGLANRTFDVDAPGSERLVYFANPLHVVPPS